MAGTQGLAAGRRPTRGCPRPQLRRGKPRHVGAEPTFYHFHPGDVRRAAPAIAEGRVDIPSDWRTDTPDGRRAEFWGALSARVAITLFIAALLCGLLLGLATVIFLLTVE